MTEQPKETWMTYMAITTVLIAVAATFSTFKGGGYSNKSLLNQTRASDQWAFYQSKSIKGYLNEMQSENLEMQLELLKNQKANPEMIARYKNKINKYTQGLKKHEEEKDAIKKVALEYEILRDECKKHSDKFGIAVIFLQLSILLSSIATLSKKKFVWICSLVLGAIGVFYFLNGFFLFA
jgi:hypothetical protein